MNQYTKVMKWTAVPVSAVLVGSACGLAADSSFDLSDVEEWSGDAAGAMMTAQPQAPAIHLMNLGMRDLLSTGAQAAKAEGAAEGFSFKQGAFSIEGFYGSSSIENANFDIRSGGASLGLAVGDPLQLKLTVPLYWTEFDKYVDVFTTGLDVGLKYRVMEGLSIGAHVNYLAHMVDVAGGGSGDTYNWGMGPSVGYCYKINDRFSVAVGAMLDYLAPEDPMPNTWNLALGAKVGVKVTDKIAVSPYYIYHRNLDATEVVEAADLQDWHDLGLEVGACLSEKFAVNLGVKTSLGMEYVESDWQLYLGLGYKF